MIRQITYASLALVLAAPMAWADDAPKWPCLNTPTLSPDFPGDVLVSDQPSFNCFAWKEFIALNWGLGADASAATFGDPGAGNPTVWEDFHTIAETMRPADHAPKSGSGKMLSRTAKLGGNFNPSFDIAEAAPSDGAAWLADKGGNLVWYEIMINSAEYDYFRELKLYVAQNQYDRTAGGKHISLPMGTVSGASGAVEIKAAWLSVEDISDAKWDRYLTREASFCSSSKAEDELHCTDGHVALVGMHIIHKTTSQPSWTWATFDHVDNVPDQAALDTVGIPGDADYLFYNQKECTPKPVPAGCKLSDPSVTETSCLPNVAPAYEIGPFKGGKVEGQCKPYAIQVTREFSLPATHENPIVQTNAMAQEMIRKANPDSVFQHYQLVNVMWSDSPVNENAGTNIPVAPLSETGFRPNISAFKVSNPVLETYAQDKSCVECHSHASIAVPDTVKNAPNYASDYSFIFGFAD